MSEACAIACVRGGRKLSVEESVCMRACLGLADSCEAAPPCVLCVPYVGAPSAIVCARPAPMQEADSSTTSRESV
eukprot:569412-Prymnesium_polylepis.1